MLFSYLRKCNILLSFGTFAQEKSSCRKILKAVRQKKICGQKSVAVLDLNIFHFSIRKCGHSCRYVFIYGALNIKQGRHVRVGLPRSCPETGQVTAKETAKSTQREYLLCRFIIFLFKELLARFTRRTFKTW